MGLFSRKKKTDPRKQQGEASDAVEPARAGGETASAELRGAVEPDGTERTPEASGADAPAAPDVSISFTAFRGVGAQSGPEVADPGEQQAGPAAGAATPSAPVQPQGFPATGGARRTPSADTRQQPVQPRLPLAPAAPPTKLESVPGVRDNAVLRDALAALPEKPSGPQVMGVLRQLLQGHAFLRVKGDAREQIAAGQPVAFGVARIKDQNYMVAFSSGKALQDAVKADGDTSTSAIAQPVPALLKQVVDGDFAGIILDNNSAPHRVVLPRAIVERAWKQADQKFRLKNAIVAPREAATPHKVAAILAERPPLWVAVGKAKDDETKVGIVEARLADGTRLVQVHSHPLEIVAQGRGEQALPITAASLGKMLRENPQVGGVIIDPAGPLMTLTREELEPVMVLTEE